MSCWELDESEPELLHYRRYTAQSASFHDIAIARDNVYFRERRDEIEIVGVYGAIGVGSMNPRFGEEIGLCRNITPRCQRHHANLTALDSFRKSDIGTQFQCQFPTALTFRIEKK